MADDLWRGNVQRVVLGAGRPRFHERLEHLADEHPGKLRTFLGFSNPLSHRIEAGADLFLMPSLYEPCGLNQLVSPAHGTDPVVRAIWGLADPVVDAAPGSWPREATPQALRATIDRAQAVGPAWNQLLEAGIRADWWSGRSGRDDLLRYEEVCRRAEARQARGPGPGSNPAMAKAIQGCHREKHLRGARGKAGVRDARLPSPGFRTERGQHFVKD